MRTKNMMRHLAWGVLGLVSQQAFSQASQANNNGGATSFLGWNALANQILDVKNEADQPIDFSTSNLFRARINPKMSYAIGTAPSDARNGFMLLSGRDNFPQQMKGPFTRLHLVDDVGANNPTTYAQAIGFRKWMRNGITFTGNLRWSGKSGQAKIATSSNHDHQEELPQTHRRLQDASGA